MGSISAVSSQTFKTYCFMAEKEGWRDGEEEKTERKRGTGMSGGAVERRNKRRGNNAYWEEMERKGESSERKQWSRKERKTMGAKRYEWVMWRKMTEEERIVRWEGEKRGGVNVLREKVRMNIHHYCGLQMFYKPQFQLHTPITFLRLASTTHTYWEPTNRLHWKWTLQYTTHLHYQEPLHSLTAHILYIWSNAYRHSVYTTCMQRDTFSWFLHFTGPYFTIYRHIKRTKVISLTAILFRCPYENMIWNYKSYLFINNSTWWYWCLCTWNLLILLIYSNLIYKLRSILYISFYI